MNNTTYNNEDDEAYYYMIDNEIAELNNVALEQQDIEDDRQLYAEFLKSRKDTAQCKLDVT